MDPHTETEAAFLKLYEEFADPLFRHCYFRVSSRELAEDLVQESFMRVWKYLAEGKTIDNQKAFLYRVAGHLIIDQYRKKKETSLDILSEGGFDPAGDDETTILSQADGQRARALFEKVDPSAREVLVLRYVNDLTIHEMAEILEVSENVVSVRLHRAVAKLKKLFHHGTTT